MKILLINNTHYVGGGADRVYINTANLLRDNGHEVIFFSTKHENNLKTDSSTYFINKKDYRDANFIEKIKGVKEYLYNDETIQKLNELIKDKKPDIAHLHLFYGGLSSSVLKTLKLNNIPIIKTVHDYRLLCPANSFLNSKNEICEKCKPKKYYNCSLNKCSENNLFYSSILAMEGYLRRIIDPLNYINHFIFVSDFSKQKHIEYDKRYKNKSSHLYNFTTIPPKNKIIKGEYFLFFGRISKEKGIHTLLKAFSVLNIKIKVVGDGPIKNELKEKYKSENIEFLGHKSGVELTEILKKANFVIVPSEWYENNPMTIIEAYSLGKPVIGAKIGGIPEIVINKQTGFLFESRNVNELIEIINFSNSIDLIGYEKLSKNARDFALFNFSEEKNYQHLINVYTRIISENEKNNRNFNS